MQSHSCVWPYMHFGVWHLMNLHPNCWYIDPKHICLLILIGNLGC